MLQGRRVTITVNLLQGVEGKTIYYRVRRSEGREFSHFTSVNLLQVEDTECHCFIPACRSTRIEIAGDLFQDKGAENSDLLLGGRAIITVNSLLDALV